MLLIPGLTQSANQTITFILSDGTTFTMTLYYNQTQQGWFINNLTYSPDSFTLNGLRIGVNPNMLFQWQNVIPFGLACATQTGLDPTLQQDFVSGNAQLYVLSAAEVAQYSETLRGNTSSNTTG